MKDTNSEKGGFYKKRRKEISGEGKSIPIGFQELEQEAKKKLRPGP